MGFLERRRVHHSDPPQSPYMTIFVVAPGLGCRVHYLSHCKYTSSYVYVHQCTRIYVYTYAYLHTGPPKCSLRFRVVSLSFCFICCSCLVQFWPSRSDRFRIASFCYDLVFASLGSDPRRFALLHRPRLCRLLLSARVGWFHTPSDIDGISSHARPMNEHNLVYP